MAVEPGRPRFAVPEVEDHADGWGPVSTPSALEGMPYAPYSKSDKIGRIADWNPQNPRSRQMDSYRTPCALCRPLTRSRLTVCVCVCVCVARARGPAVQYGGAEPNVHLLPGRGRGELPARGQPHAHAAQQHGRVPHHGARPTPTPTHPSRLARSDRVPPSRTTAGSSAVGSAAGPTFSGSTATRVAGAAGYGPRHRAAWASWAQSVGRWVRVAQNTFGGGRGGGRRFQQWRDFDKVRRTDERNGQTWAGRLCAED
jgi:hypothetical protein